MEIINNHSYGYSTANGTLKSSDSLPVNSDFQTFLKMLTAQITHQDPLNPMEGSDFAVQLATFAGVEQQTQTNKILQLISDASASDHVTKLSHLIGRRVLTTTLPHYSGEPIEVQIPAYEEVGDAFLVVSDVYGQEVERYKVTGNDVDFFWPPLESESNVDIPAGKYMFHLEVFREGDLVKSELAGSYADVVGAEASRDGARLLLNGNIRVSSDEVMAIR